MRFVQNLQLQYVMLYAISYHLNNFKNVNNICGGVLLLVKVTLFHGDFSRFLKSTNSTKSRNGVLYIVTLALGLSSLLPTVVMIWHKHSMSSPISTNETRFFLANN